MPTLEQMKATEEKTRAMQNLSNWEQRELERLIAPDGVVERYVKNRQRTLFNVPYDLLFSGCQEQLARDMCRFDPLSSGDKLPSLSELSIQEIRELSSEEFTMRKKNESIKRNKFYNLVMYRSTSATARAYLRKHVIDPMTGEHYFKDVVSDGTDDAEAASIETVIGDSRDNIDDLLTIESYEFFLSCLPEKAKAIFELKGKGFTQEEIAIELGCVQGTVSNTLKRHQELFIKIVIDGE